MRLNSTLKKLIIIGAVAIPILRIACIFIPIPSAFMQLLNILFFAITIFSIIYVIIEPDIEGGQKALWVVLIFVFSPISVPLFALMHIKDALES